MDKINKMADELMNAAALRKDEFGKWWSLLFNLVPAYRNSASPDFALAIEREIARECDRLKKEFRVVETKRLVATYELLHKSEEA